MNKRKEKYWMCEDCSKLRGWQLPDFGVTVIKGLCGHCDREDEDTLIPTIDFIKEGKRPLFD